VKQDKLKVDLSGLSETFLFPLWGRAKLSNDCSWLFNDVRATESVEKIDYDFSKFDRILLGCRFDRGALTDSLPPLFALRAKQFDRKIQSYIAEHPRASVMNIGSGLDTTFYRVDNGLIHWYDLDLPPVIKIRNQLLPEADTTNCIAKSLLDPSWCNCIK
jgi:O-methyltransferase involved in polyketide biosynthesis